MNWLWWLGLALVLGVIELLTVDLTFLMLAGGAAAAGLVGALGAPIWLQLIVGTIVAVLLLVIVRPMAQRRLHARTGIEVIPDNLTNVGAHVGRTAVVLSDVGDRSGRVKLEGEVWSARTDAPGQLFSAGTTVVVTKIDGATAVVAAPVQDAPHQPYGQPGPGYGPT